MIVLFFIINIWGFLSGNISLKWSRTKSAETEKNSSKNQTETVIEDSNGKIIIGETAAGADDETVVGANYSGCVGQDIVLRFSAGTGQYYTLSSGSEYGVIINQFYRKTSSSEMLGVSESYTNECTLRFDSVGKYNIVLTGNTANDSIAFCIDVRDRKSVV